MVKTLPSGSIPGLRTKIPHAVQFGPKNEMSFFLRGSGVTVRQ